MGGSEEDVERLGLTVSVSRKRGGGTDPPIAGVIQDSRAIGELRK